MFRSTQRLCRHGISSTRSNCSLNNSSLDQQIALGVATSHTNHNRSLHNSNFNNNYTTTTHNNHTNTNNNNQSINSIKKPKSLDSIKRVVLFRKVSLLEQRQETVDDNVPCQSLADEKTKFSHFENLRAVEKVQEILFQKNIETHVVKNLEADMLPWADLVISVGGDGTFLRATQKFSETETVPILGVNSSPHSSYGYFCAATRDNFEQVLDKLLSACSHEGRVPAFPLWRMKIIINGKPQDVLALNDVLYASDNAAATVRYVLNYKGKKQTQKSSGIWVSTPAGSTAAIASAGGERLDLSERKLQFRVRELFRESIIDEPIVGGLIDDGFELTSRMPHGKVYVDGHRHAIDFHFGDHVTFKLSESPLWWIRPSLPEQHWRSERWRAPWEKVFARESHCEPNA